MTRLVAATLVVAALVALAAFFIGRGLRGEDAAPAAAFDQAGPSYQVQELVLGRSVAGFSGVAAAGPLAGSGLYSGRITEVTAESVTIATEAGETTLGLNGDGKLYRIEPFSGGIEVGANVVVRVVPGSDEVVALLVVLPE